MTARRFLFVFFHTVSDCIRWLLKETMEFRKFPEVSNLLKDNEHCIKELSAVIDPDKINISIKETPPKKVQMAEHLNFNMPCSLHSIDIPREAC